jgi:hypothetical protein
MSLNISPSPFGTLVVSVAETGSTLSVSTVATAPTVLSMALGVPGPAGETGATGPAGTPGTNGVGVPTGGSAGQVLSKIDGTNYNTHWTDVASGGGTWGSITGTLSNQTDLQNALDGKLNLSGGTMSGAIDFSAGSGATDSEVASWGFGVESTDGGYSTLTPNLLTVRGVDGGVTKQVTVSGTGGITFSDNSVQVTKGLVNGDTFWDTNQLLFYIYDNYPSEGGHVKGTTIIGSDGMETTFLKIVGIGSTNGIGFYTNTDTGYNSGAWIQFSDTTIQTTAFIPADYLSTASAVSNYLSIANASSTYLSQSNASATYLTQSSASSTYAPLASPTFTGDPKAPTPATTDNDTSIATTAFVQSAIQSVTAGSTNSVLYSVRNSTGATLTAGTIVYINGATGNKATVAKALATSDATSAQTLGMVTVDIPNNTEGNVTVIGTVSNLNTNGLTEGTQLYLSGTTAGEYTTTKPFAPTHLVYVGVVTRAHPNLGTIQVKVQNGYEMDEIHNASCTAPANADGLFYNTSNSLWESKSITSALGYTPLSSTTASATYQTISGMSSYLSTASASANYLTISNASSTYLSTSAASSTYIAQSQYATTAQAQAGSSTSAVISASTLLDAKYFSGGKYVNAIVWTSATSGTGSNGFAQNANGRYVQAPTSATGYAIASAILTNNSRGTTFQSGYDFSKRIVFGARFCRNVVTPDTASVFRYSVGKSSSTDASDLSARGLMIKVAGSGAMQLLVHNGTSLTTVTSSFTPSNLQAYDVVVVSDGSGNATLYVNGSSVATTTGAPTSAGATNAGQLTLEVQNTSALTNSAHQICGSDFFVQVNS